MYYDPEKNDHGLARSPFKSCVVPRPIGWISIGQRSRHSQSCSIQPVSEPGLRPGLCDDIGEPGRSRKAKDTVVNIEETGEFVYNMATYDLREAVNRSAAEVPPETDEFDIAGVTKALSMRVKPFRVAESAHPVRVLPPFNRTSSGKKRAGGSRRHHRPRGAYSHQG